MVVFRVVMLSLVMFIGVAASCNKSETAPETEVVEEIEEAAPTSYLNEYPNETAGSIDDSSASFDESAKLETSEDEGYDPE